MDVSISYEEATILMKELEPKKVFDYFKEISAIPRCSKNEKEISDYLVNFAKENKLEVFQDKALNVIIKKNGTKGYEDSAPVIIQGHMDMVCEKSKESKHDFSKDPISLKVKGDFLRADGTTLGGDNGIAIAYGLALLDSKDIPHPPIELLITTDEETGMYGAAAIKADLLKGKTLLNIDAEEEGVFFVSCAGGMNLICEFDTKWESATKKALIIEISGLKGGHSGLEIDQQRANAIKILGRILKEIRNAGDYNIANIAGGLKSNAIAREAKATITADTAVINKIKASIEDLSKIIKDEFLTVDSEIQVKVGNAEKITTQLDKVSTNKIVDFLFVVPNGVQSMSMEKGLEGIVESSLNLGILEQSEKSIKLTISVRSSVESIMDDVAKRVETLTSLVGAKSSRSGVYPSWEYEADSKIRDMCIKVYKEVSGNEAKIQSIHAGLECGVLKKKMPKTDMISFGPNIYNVHTPDEHVSIKSVKNLWEFIKALLTELK